MHYQSRRHFIRTTLSTAGLLAAAPQYVFGDETPAKELAGSDQVLLGRTGIKASRLAQGTGFNGSARSSAHTRMGFEAFDRLLRHSLDQGVTFIDMADLYGSHPFVQKSVRGISRDKLVLLSKIWVFKDSWVNPSGGAKEEIDRYRKELNSDQIDIVLIHCMQEAKWPDTQKRVLDELAELQEKKVIRAKGVSCHDLGALKEAAVNPWVDVIFARINNRGGAQYAMDGSVEAVSEVLKLARKNGKAVVGMKIFGAGALVKPEEKDASLKYVLGNQLVDAMTIGMLSTDQVDDTLKHIREATRV